MQSSACHFLICLVVVGMGLGCESSRQGRRHEQAAQNCSACKAVVDYFRNLEATFLEFSSDGDLVGIDSHSTFTDEAMAKLRGCSRLEYLSLVGAPITDEGVKCLIGKKFLNRLVLNRSRITDISAKQISQLRQLRELDLGWTKITDASVDQLSKLEHLESLVIEGTLISPNGAARLKKLLPTLEILY